MQGIWFDLILSTFGRWIRMRPYLNNFPNMIPIDLFVNKQVDTNWSRSSIDYPLRIEWQDRGIYSTHSLKCSRAHRGKSPRTKISWLCSARAQIFGQIPARTCVGVHRHLWYSNRDYHLISTVNRYLILSIGAVHISKFCSSEVIIQFSE